MNLGILDFIYDGYSSHSRLGKDIREVEAFNKKYINPQLEKNSKEGLRMEAMFNSALAESNVQSFKNGFKVCMYFMTECINGDL